MKFTKMHGTGNDFIFLLDLNNEYVGQEESLAKKLCHRRFGIGADGLVLVRNSNVADIQMVIINSDGSRANMCGNAIRCVAKYVYEKGMTNKTNIDIDTLAGIKHLELFIDKENKVENVRVDMGKPILTPENIPIISPTGSSIKVPITVGGKLYLVTCVSMGNPHAVVFMNDVQDLNIEKIGPLFENHERCPNRINTEFVNVIDRHTAQMRVWERGSGETLACGTGACAVAVACILNGLTENTVTVKLLGGDLQIEWDREKNTVYMTGPAEVSFDGVWKEK